jgi:hypothetical protein
MPAGIETKNKHGIANTCGSGGLRLQRLSVKIGRDQSMVLPKRTLASRIVWSVGAMSVSVLIMTTPQKPSGAFFAQNAILQSACFATTQN